LIKYTSVRGSRNTCITHIEFKITFTKKRPRVELLTYNVRYSIQKTCTYEGGVSGVSSRITMHTYIYIWRKTSIIVKSNNENGEVYEIINDE